MDFVVQSPKELGYYQVCKTLNAQEIMQRELAPLKKLRDNCKKTILTMDNLE
jgi:predicted AAA+ superfamily ATPase